ncbi:MAG: hypothetical protein AABN33_00400 [Acidobacteriota bacterium]
MNRLVLFLMCVGVLIANSHAFFAPYDDKKPATQKAHEEALRGFDRAKFDAYKATLPKDGSYYVVEGDLLLTEAELQDYAVGKANPDTQEKRVVPNSELLVNLLQDGKKDYYEDVSQRTLTYAVDRQSFPNKSRYDQLVKNVRRAAGEWQSACQTCQIKMVHVTEHDASPSTEKVNFIVRYHDSGGDYIAAAFFPHYAPLRRNLNIDPSYYTTSFDKVGVLRHELGHVLGYRHEHIQGVPGCYVEDDRWEPLTRYDPNSVMHYFCGGGGSMKLKITKSDKLGHQKLYGPGGGQ